MTKEKAERCPRRECLRGSKISCVKCRREITSFRSETLDLPSYGLLGMCPSSPVGVAGARV